MKLTARFSVAALGTVLLVAAGCDSSGTQKAVERPAPEVSFNEMAKAIRFHDWETAFEYIDETSQITMLGAVMIGMYRASIRQSVMNDDVTKRDAYYELLKSLNIDLEYVKQNWGNPSVNQRESVQTALADITNRGDVMNQVMAFGKQNFPSLVGDRTPIGLLANGSVKDVQIDGDVATAKLIVNSYDREGLPVSFVRIEGEWFFSQPR